MKASLKRIAIAAAASVVTVTTLPCQLTLSAEETYLVRDPFYNYASGCNYYETEHFQFIWGSSGDSSRVTTEFLEGNAKNLEACWDVYMVDLQMEAPSQSTNLSLRDGNHYKTNIYLSGTGLSGMQDDWAYMSYDSEGYAYMFCCVDSMQYEPPSWVLPHEFGHVVTAHQLGWNNNKYSYAWWESMGNWYREQYLYSDYSTDETGHGTDFFETYLKNLSLTFPCGRDYYAAWPFLQYLTENPDDLAGYGTDFVKALLQEGQADEYPFDMVERLAEADLKDTLGHFAKHMAGLDFENGNAYRARLNELLSAGSWNWQQIYTMLEPVAGVENTYQVPTERAPQHAGMNIIPLTVTGDIITVTLNGQTDIAGADWRACIVQQLSDGSCVYSDLFSDGETMSATAVSGAAAAYLSVVATPDNNTYTKAGLPYGPDSEFAESKLAYTDKQQYPYSVVLTGADITERTVSTGTNWWESYHSHTNGGGLVSDSATVDESVYVAPNAMVLGSAKVTGNVRIEDHAVVQDNAVVSDNAVIAGYAIVAENAVISGNARVDDTALVMGKANISGNARVIESALVYGEVTMKDNACAKGMAFCMANGSISGQGVIDGDYYDDGGKTVTKG
ncbi:MAG: N-acetylglucosamine-1-phosphate uridyltransferase, partial [Ruminococcus sp.]|nr:N-acetylglucosamine-1-phosphate uridyltransferase [Ruminococcus sp.]